MPHTKPRSHGEAACLCGFVAPCEQIKRRSSIARQSWSHTEPQRSMPLLRGFVAPCEILLHSGCAHGGPASCPRREVDPKCRSCLTLLRATGTMNRL
jgi:hypothetical protein